MIVLNQGCSEDGCGRQDVLAHRIEVGGGGGETRRCCGPGTRCALQSEGVIVELQDFLSGVCCQNELLDRGRDVHALRDG